MALLLELCEDADLFEMVAPFCRAAGLPRLRVPGGGLLVLDGDLLILLFSANISEDALIEIFSSLTIPIKVLKIATRK